MIESPLFQKFNIPLYQDDEIVEEEEETFGPFGPYVSSLFYSENKTIQSGYSSALSAVAMEVVEAEVVGATGVEVEVEDIPLEEDQEFRRTILRPESNLRPTGDEWIVPIVLFPEPIVKVKENVGDNDKHMDNQQETPTTVPMEVEEEQSPVSMEHPVHQQQQQLRPTGDEWIVPIVLFQEPIVHNQQETSTTVPMEVEEEQSPVSMEHPVHQQQQQPSTEHLADKDALTKMSEKKVSKNVL